MSREHVELVREVFRVFEVEGPEAAVSLLPADFVWYTTERWLEGSAYRGHAGMRKLSDGWSDNFDRWGYEVRELRDLGDRVVALVDMVGQIKNAGPQVSQPLGLVISEFHDGTFAEVRAFPSWNEALEAAGAQP